MARFVKGDMVRYLNQTFVVFMPFGTRALLETEEGRLITGGPVMQSDLVIAQVDLVESAVARGRWRRSRSAT